MKNRLLQCTLFTVLSFASGLAAAAESPQKSTATVVQTEIRYLTFLPKSYSANGEPVPLIIFLHGSGERGNDLNKVKAWGPPAIVEKNRDFPFMVISPQVPDGEAWHSNLLKGMIDDVLAHYNVDRKRVYLTGLSMGGYGVWDLAIRYPEYFAAIAPICGGGMPIWVGRIKDVPTWVFHGKKDTAVPEQESANMVAALQAAGGDVKYTVLPEGSHGDAWKFAYDKAGLFDWFLQHHK